MSSKPSEPPKDFSRRVISRKSSLGGRISANGHKDIVSRESLYDSTAKKTLITVTEDGEPPKQFQLGDCIGHSQSNSVYRALNLDNGQVVAIKRIRLSRLSEEEVARLMKEVDLMKSLSHPNIIKYQDITRDAENLNIILEYAENGSLRQQLKAFGKLNENLVASFVTMILKALHYLHSNDIIHSDLKAANILTTKHGNVKISDFGLSLNVRALESRIKDIAQAVTANWMAPEVIELKGPSTKSDIWSLACTIIELVTTQPPYANIPSSMAVMFSVVEDKVPPIPESCSPLLRDLLVQCFEKDPSKRPSAEQLLKHQWLNPKGSEEQHSIPFPRMPDEGPSRSDVIRSLSPITIPEASGAAWNYIRTRRDSEHTPNREHSFVKTSFSKPVVCHVCHAQVKKRAVLCEHCSLISHLKCVPSVSSTCDLRVQLLLESTSTHDLTRPVEFSGRPPSKPTEPVLEIQSSGQTLASPTSTRCGIRGKRKTERGANKCCIQ